MLDASDWLDLSTAPELRHAVQEALEDAPDLLTVDLQRCSGADAYGVRVLCDLQREARRRGTELRVVHVARRVRRVLDLLGVTSLTLVPSTGGHAR